MHLKEFDGMNYNAGQKKRNSDPFLFCELPGRGRSTLKVVDCWTVVKVEPPPSGVSQKILNSELRFF